MPKKLSFAVLVCLAIALFFMGLRKPPVASEAAARAASAGRLIEIDGMPVLQLFGGDIKARGFAHGWFLGEQMVVCLDSALRSLPRFDKEEFNERLLPWAKQNFYWDDESQAEFDGLYEGAFARLGEKGLYCAALGRSLKRDDLLAMNTIADLFGPGCSGFSAWGNATQDGKVIQGRNLDFPMGSRAAEFQTVIASAPLPQSKFGPARKAWLAIGWPGLTCIFSAMNEHGLVCNLHDANNVIRGGAKTGFIARGLLLRRMVESIDPARSDAARQAQQLAAQRPAACGNLFHLTWPQAAADSTGTKPAAIIEFDGNHNVPGQPPVVIRRPVQSESLVLTNHYCVRCEELVCGRFQRISASILDLVGSGKKIDLLASRKILIAGELPYAAHTLVFEPDERLVHVAITRGNVLSTRTRSVPIRWEQSFAR